MIGVEHYQVDGRDRINVTINNELAPVLSSLICMARPQGAAIYTLPTGIIITVTVLPPSRFPESMPAPTTIDGDAQ